MADRDIPQLLSAPEMVQMVSKAVSADVTKTLKNEVATEFIETLKKEIAGLRDIITQKDKEIDELKDRVDDLEQHSRRNNLRITGIPETTDEDTDKIVMDVAKAVGVDLELDNIERSHRVGRKTEMGAAAARPILVKFASYRHKRRLITQKRKLTHADPKKIAPHAPWPTPAQSSQQGSRVYLNDDLTRARAEMAATAREKLKRKEIEGTWVRDGVIFVKTSDARVHRVTTKRQLEAI